MDIKELESILYNNLETEYLIKNWSKIESLLGISLPSDYKKFVNSTNDFCVNDFIWVLDPFTNNVFLNLINKGNEMIKSYNTLKNLYPKDFLHNVYPDKNGLLPCAITENGDEIFWLTSDKVDEWKIIVYETRTSNYFEYSKGLIEFLYKILIREIECPIFPSEIFE